MNRIWTLTESERWPSGSCIPGKWENGGESHRRKSGLGRWIMCLILATLNMRSKWDRVEISNRSLELMRKSGWKCKRGFISRQMIPEAMCRAPLETKCSREGAQDQTHGDSKDYWLGRSRRERWESRKVHWNRSQEERVLERREWPTGQVSLEC